MNTLATILRIINLVTIPFERLTWALRMMIVLLEEDEQTS
jgi:hypothetical protein